MVTLIACLLLGLEYGIVIGIGCNLLFILFNTSRPRLQCECITVDNGQQVILVTPDQSLFFSAAEYVKYKILKAITEHPDASMVILNGHFVHHIDATMAANLKTLVDDCGLLNKLVLFWNWQPQPMGVAIRLTAEFKPIFKHSPSLDSLVEMVNSNNSNAVAIVPSLSEVEDRSR